MISFLAAYRSVLLSPALSCGDIWSWWDAFLCLLFWQQKVPSLSCDQKWWASCSYEFLGGLLLTSVVKGFVHSQVVGVGVRKVSPDLSHICNCNSTKEGLIMSCTLVIMPTCEYPKTLPVCLAQSTVYLGKILHWQAIPLKQCHDFTLAFLS